MNSDDELSEALRKMADLLVAVATGGPRIDDVNVEYRELRDWVETELAGRSLDSKIPFTDLWEWYGRFSGGDFPTWRSRRLFVGELLQAQMKEIQSRRDPLTDRVEATGWSRVDRTSGEVRKRLAQAQTEEQFQAVGVLCRETLISLAQAVYVYEKHPSEDGVRPSSGDVKRMLGAFIATEFAGGPNKVARGHAKAAFDLANELQHSRTATFRDAALCAEATTGVVNVIAIVSGQRDP